MDDIRFIDRFSREYPVKLNAIDGPPAGIYVRGKMPDPDIPCVAIVGSRNCSEYGKYMARYFASALSEEGIQIISGMARGVDGIAQETAIDAGAGTFGILGCGVDVVYPKENERIFAKILDKGGLMAEVPPGSPALKSQFPSRNRIISALADVLLVIEARIKSGTGITVRFALEQGKDIFAVPGRLTDPLSAGCNRLISEGAGIARSPEDIIHVLKAGRDGFGKEYDRNTSGTVSGDICGFRKLALAGTEKVVYSLLDLYPKTLDEIVSAGRMSVPDAMEALLGLEMKDLASECARNHYIKKT